MRLIRIIVNADDLGCSITVNKNIFSLMDRQKVSSATLMANGPAFQDAIQHIPEFANFSFGVHLTLTEFPALTTPQIFYDKKIIDEKGVFTGNVRQASPSYALLRAVGIEWEQQVTKILDNGISISHFDSHHHTHTVPWLFLPLKTIQKRFNIQKTRISMNLYNHKECLPSRKLLLSKKMWNWALRNLYLTKTTDYCTEFRWFLDILANSGIGINSTIELMCHPGQPYSTKETELLYSDWAKQVPFEIELISYKEL